MSHLNPVERWITTATGRTLDQHAVDPIPAAAHLPEAADDLRHLRDELLLAVDHLRTTLLNEDDLHASAAAITGTAKTIQDLAREYGNARSRIDALIGDETRTAYALTHPGQQVRRHYVDAGDTVLVVLPHTDSCRAQNLAGHTAYIRVGSSDARFRLPGSVSAARLAHSDAGIYRDRTEYRLYTLQPAACSPTTSGR